METNKDELPQTGQTGQEPHTTPFFEIAEDSHGKWHWVLWSGNGRQMAVNAIAYDRRADCISAIRAAADAMPRANVITRSHFK